MNAQMFIVGGLLVGTMLSLSILFRAHKLSEELWSKKYAMQHAPARKRPE